jgi:DNA-binding transcriptional ArsR family regulator
MNQALAIDAFGALAHDTRLSVFRLLVRRGPQGTPAMEVGRMLDLKPSTLSGHLAALKRAGLVTAERNHREILYAPNFDTVNGLVTFLLRDCCGGDEMACAGITPSMELIPRERSSGLFDASPMGMRRSDTQGPPKANSKARQEPE